MLHNTQFVFHKNEHLATVQLHEKMMMATVHLHEGDSGLDWALVMVG
jgi:hypothetical protein